jgi:hypothetical protein
MTAIDLMSHRILLFSGYFLVSGYFIELYKPSMIVQYIQFGDRRQEGGGPVCTKILRPNAKEAAQLFR